MTCYLVRHGKDDDTVRGGWSEQPLSDEGKAQAEALACLVQSRDLGIQCIYSSDLVRAMQTAQIVADKLQVPIMPMPEFREVNNGDLAGMKNDLADKVYPGLYWNTLDWEQRYPGGESPKEFYERVSTAWNAFQKMVLEQNETVMLVTHGGVINVILSVVNGQQYANKLYFPKIPNAELITMEYRGESWSVTR